MARFISGQVIFLFPTHSLYFIVIWVLRCPKTNFTSLEVCFGSFSCWNSQRGKIFFFAAFLLTHKSICIWRDLVLKVQNYFRKTSPGYHIVTFVFHSTLTKFKVQLCIFRSACSLLVSLIESYALLCTVRMLTCKFGV